MKMGEERERCPFFGRIGKGVGGWTEELFLLLLRLEMGRWEETCDGGREWSGKKRVWV